jgi:4-alpha-glucanotransferase
VSIEVAPEWAPVPDDLARLAAALGVATDYWDQAGNHVEVAAATVEAVLKALEVDVSTPESIQAALDDIAMRDWRRMLPPVYVMRQGADQRLWVHVPHGSAVQVHVDAEDGRRLPLQQMDWWVDPVDVDGVLVGEASFRLPADLPLGWHTVVAESGGQRATTPLVVAPLRLDPEAITGPRQWGFMTQVYAMRSADSWGLGDLHDLATLASWSGRDLGAGFVLINPLHAASPVPPMSPSPYLPVTRRFANPMYLRIEDIPEYRRLSPAVLARVEQLAGQLQRLNTSADLLDRDAVWGAKRIALEAVFQAGMGAERRAELDAYLAAQGSGLRDFATWCALSDVHGPDPAGLARRAGAPGRPGGGGVPPVARGRGRLPHVDAVAGRLAAGRDAGGRSGGRDGHRRHARPRRGRAPRGRRRVGAAGRARGRRRGGRATPDMYNQMGQNWHQPPWRPDALAEAAFVPYRDMLRTVLGHAGGLRIDHVLGLFRLWWVPEGFPAYAGTFVRLDFDAMLSILMLEAHRAGAIVVGEDLGTVEPWVQEALAERGILGTSILWFETADGAIKDPEQWRGEVLASVTVHDLPPTAGYLRNEHVRIRSELGLLTTPEDVELANAARERAAWAAILRSHGWLAHDVDIETEPGLEELVVALHRAVAGSPARLIGVSLPDVAGDRRAQNQPGTDQEYPNWRIPMTDELGRPVLLEALMDRPDLLARIVGTIGRVAP